MRQPYSYSCSYSSEHHSPYPVRRWLIGLAALLIAAAGAAESPGELRDDDVRQAIERGVRYLQSQQLKDGSWSSYPDKPGGSTALCALTMMNCGVPAEDPSVALALTHLRELDPANSLGRAGRFTYTAALRVMAMCAANQKSDLLTIQADVGWLMKAQRTSGKFKGGWGYGEEGQSGDNSNAQFALLAMYEAERMGVKLPLMEQSWNLALTYWLKNQHQDGGWSYQNDGAPTGSMTCAGIASVIIASGQVGSLDARLQGSDVLCCGQQEATDQEAIERGLAWMARHFSVDRNPGSNLYNLYYLYALERVGRMSGRRFMGEHDWYREGVERLLRQQDRFSGFWDEDHDRTISTALALLFLSKGRRPVLVSKLKYDDTSADWNHHRNDLSHLTAHVETRWKRDLSWQVVDGKQATAEDLWQSPVVFISGRDRLQLSATEKENLRRYIDLGGFLFVEACCQGTGFDRDFRALMAELFPESPLRILPPDHPIWIADQKVDARYLRPLYGIDACCRTGVVYCPADLSCYWELASRLRSRQADRYPAAVQDEIEACLAIGTNVLTYATGRELRNKLDVPEPVSVLKDQGPRDRGTFYVAKLQHGGGSDDAPSALVNLLTILGQHTQLRVSTARQLMNIADPTLPDFPVAFMHGRRTFRLTANQRKSLRSFVENGGVLFADAICANDQFARSFRDEIQTIFPEHRWHRIPPDHLLFTQEYHGQDIRTVTLRDPRSRASADDPLAVKLEKVSPLLEGIEIDGRFVVIFSPYDLSCALENRPSLECRGYTTADAARIGVNVLLYAMQQ